MIANSPKDRLLNCALRIHYEVLYCVKMNCFSPHSPTSCCLMQFLLSLRLQHLPKTFPLHLSKTFPLHLQMPLLFLTVAHWPRLNSC